MIEGGVWEVAKAVLQFAVAPALGFFVWLHKKQDGRITELEERASNSEKSSAVVDVRIEYMYKSQQRIEEKLDKLIDRRKTSRNSDGN